MKSLTTHINEQLNESLTLQANIKFPIDNVELWKIDEAIKKFGAIVVSNNKDNAFYNTTTRFLQANVKSTKIAEDFFNAFLTAYIGKTTQGSVSPNTGNLVFEIATENKAIVKYSAEYVSSGNRQKLKVVKS